MLRSLRSARRCTGLVLAGLLLACMAGQGVASPIYDTSAVGELTGTRTEGAGLMTGGAYATDRSAFTMSWVITPLGGDTFHYQYTFDGFNTQPPGVSTGPKSPNISHIILDLSESCVAVGHTSSWGPLDQPRPIRGFPAGPALAGSSSTTPPGRRLF